MIQALKNAIGRRNFEARLPELQVTNEVNAPQDVVDISSMKTLIDGVMVAFRGNEQMGNDLNRKEGFVVGSVEYSCSSYSGTLEYDPKTEKPVNFKAEHVYGFPSSSTGKSARISMEFRDDGKTAAYTFTSDKQSLFRINDHFWHIKGTESLVMDSRTGAILEMNVAKS